MRFARQYLLVDPSDCIAPHGLVLTYGSRDSMKVGSLEKAFLDEGFDESKPALVGYPKDGRIQLLSGTHRHEAARRAGIRLPVRIHLRSTVEALWGTPEWMSLIEDVPVSELEYAEVSENRWAPGLDERVDLSNGYPCL